MQPFYVPAGAGLFTSTASTVGPWSAQAQHGGPPAALLVRAVEELAPQQVLGRFTMELLGPVPVGPLRVAARVVRPGRTVALAEATAYDVERGRACVRVSAWLFPRREDGPWPADRHSVGHTPDDGVPRDYPSSWLGGYLDAVEWRWVRGSVAEPGDAVVWMRPRVALVEGEQMTPLQRLAACVDSASGASAVLDPAEWGFMNTDLTVHVLREPVGAWVCLEAQTVLGPGSVGLATSLVHDERGLVARTAQALLVVPR